MNAGGASFGAQRLVGKVLGGKYRIVRVVGEGGMGSVLEAEHEILHTRVAIKIVAPEFGRDADAIERLQREAMAAARIGHENICGMIDLGRTPSGLPFIVMELLQGRALSAALAEVRPFPIGRMIDIATQVLEGLGAAHAAGVVHRDIKPDNIFLTRVAGRDDFVKLLDFGISKMRAGAEAAGRKLTRDGSVLGTPEYMSPEQARGQTDVDARADIWAVGVVVYEMLAGNPPFSGANYNEILYQVLAAPIAAPSTRRAGVPPLLDAVVMRALERDVAKRFQTAGEFREGLLGAWLATEQRPAVVSTRPGVGSRLPPPPLAAGPRAAQGRVARPGSAARDAADDVADEGTSGAFAPTIATGSGQAAHSTVGTGSTAQAVAGALPAVPDLVVPGGTIRATASGTTVSTGAARRRLPRPPVLVAAGVGLAVIAALVVVLAARIGSKDDSRAAAAERPASTAAPAASGPARMSEPPPASKTTFVPDTPSPAVAGTAPMEATGAFDLDDPSGYPESLPEPESGALVGPPSAPGGGHGRGGTGSGARRPAGTSGTDATVVAVVTGGLPGPDAAGRRTGAESEDAAAGAASPTGPDARSNGRDAGTTTPETGTLSVTTEPPTQVYFDDEMLGLAPFTGREVRAGRHRMRFVSEAFGIRHEERVSILPGRETFIRRTADQLRGPSEAPPAVAPADAGSGRDGFRLLTTYGADGR